MKLKNYFFLLCFSLCMVALSSCKNSHSVVEAEDEENEKYDGPAERAKQEFEMTKDPATGTVPYDRLYSAINYTSALKTANAYSTMSVLWTDRGSYYDSVGPSNGNGRGGGTGFTGGYTSGRMLCIMIDSADPTGNTVFCGGAEGGIWKCTNFLTNPATWTAINDNLANLSITSICQDPTNLDIMYLSTGEPMWNVDAVRGAGVFKSTDHGATWTLLSQTTSFKGAWKILCDASGDVFVATGNYSGSNGLQRSTNGGATWVNITPSVISNTTACTDIEISSTGRLHAVFGYFGTSITYRYTDFPSTVSSTSWSSGTGLHPSTTTVTRMEIACLGDILYAVTCNSAYNMDSCYISTNGGLNWRKKNTTVYTTNLGSGQGWYAETLAINPSDPSQIMIGGLDAYKSADSGTTISRVTYWVSTAPYVHADHHALIWTTVGAESRLLMGTDGGLFYSNNGGMTFTDRNRNLSLKQFYSCAIHPTTTDYLLGGAQDNGCHQFKNPGASYSIEVTGGDGAYVAIDQQNPQNQFGSYVYSVYRRSTNSGAAWTSITIGSNTGQFINPFEYDGKSQKMYCCNTTGTLLRWENPLTANPGTTTTLTYSAYASGYANALTISPYTNNRLYMGTTGGKLLRIEHVDTLTQTYLGSNITDITGPSFSGTLNCVAVGSSDNYLLAIFTNYGINNIWYSSDGGSTWTGIDGNLPDMPVRWAVFHPTNNNKILIATEAGVYTTLNVNGASTQWFPSPGFPTVRTDMLRLRASDNTVVAATHGRGMWTGNIIDILPVKKVELNGSLVGENSSHLSWVATDATNRVQYHLQYSTDGVSFTEIANLPATTLQFMHTLTATTGYYRVMAVDPNTAPVFSNVVAIKASKPAKGLQLKVVPNPMTTSGNFILSSSDGGAYTWFLSDMQGRVIQTNHGSLAVGGSANQAIEVSKLSSGMYVIRAVQGNLTTTATFIKQ